MSSARHMPAEQLILLLGKAEAMGLSADELLRQCRLSFSYADLRSKRIRRVPMRDFARLGQICYQQLRQANARNGLSREDFNLMCHALVTSVTLREVIERQSRLFDLCDRRHGWMELRESSGEASIELHLGPLEQCWNTFFLINGLMVFARLFDWLIGGSLQPRFQLARACDKETSVVASVCSVQMDYGRAFDGFSFSAACLDRPVVRDGIEMRQFLEIFPFDVFVAMDTRVSLSTQIAAVYRDAMLNGRPLPSLVALACNFSMASATLRRHLEAEGTSINRIKDRVRHDVSLDLLNSGHSHLEQIAMMLGFSGAKAFTRAFIKWSGTTPTAYRRHLATREPPPYVRGPAASAAVKDTSGIAAIHHPAIRRSARALP